MRFSSRLTVACALLSAAWACTAGSRDLPGDVGDLRVVELEQVQAGTLTGFTRISVVRELSDARVIVADAGANRILVADFATKATRDAATPGGGPGEIEEVMEIAPLPGDSTLMPDLAALRFTVFDGARPGTVTRLANGHRVADFLARVGSVRGGDDLGRVLFEVPPPLDGGERDSTILVRLDWRTGGADTIGRARPVRTLTRQVRRDSTGMVTHYQATVPAWPSSERATICGDGWTAIARLDPYRVDWRSPAGEWRLGAAIAYERTVADRREREFYIEEQFARRSSRRAPAVNDISWPDEVPPVRPASRMWCLATGEALVHRMETASTPIASYDMVDRAGARVGRLVLGAREAIVGIGRQYVYVVSEDADGLQQLHRRRVR